MTAGSGRRPRVAAIIPTLGERRLILQTLEALRSQTVTVDRIVVVLQGESEWLPGALASIGDTRVRLVCAPRGLARARNAGIRELRDLERVVIGFADDDVVFDPDAVAVALEEIAAGADVVTGRLVSEGGLRAKFPELKVELNNRNVWRAALEGLMFATRDYCETVGGFDEDLGLGSGTPWGSGEGTDFLLKGLAFGRRLTFTPRLAARELSAPALPSAARSRAYARGTGYVYGRHYGVSGQVRAVVGALVRTASSAIRGDFAKLPEGWAVLLGRLEGLAGYRASANGGERRRFDAAQRSRPTRAGGGSVR